LCLFSPGKIKIILQESKPMQKFTSNQVKELLPPEYQAIAGQSFTTPTGHRAYIRVRIKNLDTKPPLYLWNTDTPSFISSLYFNAESQRFVFDYTLTNGERHFSSIDTKLNIFPEEKGYYKKDDRVITVFKTL